MLQLSTVLLCVYNVGVPHQKCDLASGYAGVFLPRVRLLEYGADVLRRVPVVQTISAHVRFAIDEPTTYFELLKNSIKLGFESCPFFVGDACSGEFSIFGQLCLYFGILK